MTAEGTDAMILQKVEKIKDQALTPNVVEEIKALSVCVSLVASKENQKEDPIFNQTVQLLVKLLERKDLPGGK